MSRELRILFFQIFVSTVTLCLATIIAFGLESGLKIGLLGGIIGGVIYNLLDKWLIKRRQKIQQEKK